MKLKSRFYNFCNSTIPESVHLFTTSNLFHATRNLHLWRFCMIENSQHYAFWSVVVHPTLNFTRLDVGLYSKKNVLEFGIIEKRILSKF